MDIGEVLDVSDAGDWRFWLEENSDTKHEIWLVFHSKASGKPSITYNAAVEQALCFGWIDSINKKYGPDARVQRFTPRRAGSPISEMNRERVRRLHAQGLMTQAGWDAIGPVLDEPFEVPPDIMAAIAEDEDAMRHFLSFPEGYRRVRIGFIEAARSRPEMFSRRLDYFLKMTKQGKRFGMVQ